MKKLVNSLIIISTTLMVMTDLNFFDPNVMLEIRASSFQLIQLLAFLFVGITIYLGMTLTDKTRNYRIGRGAIVMSLFTLAISPTFIVTSLNLVVWHRFVTNHVWIKSQLIVLILMILGTWGLIRSYQLEKDC